MAAVSNVIPFGLLFMRPLQWCLKTKGVLPEGKPALHDQGHAAMPTCLGHVEKTLVLVSGPGAGSSLSPCMLATDASLIGWGVVMSGPPARGLWSSHHPDLRALGRLACQPCRCFRAQRSPASPHLSLPPGNVAELGSSTPLRGSLQQLVRLSPAGHPFQDTELAAHTRGQSRETERGYRIQFGAPPPPFYGVSTVVSPEQGLVMEQEVETHLRKEATEVVPPHERESGFYSRYFIVPKKDGGLRPILDLRLLNRSVKRLKFKMLTIKQVVSQIRSEDWFVTIDLKDAYFHVSILPQHRKFLRFAFRGEAYQYRVLSFGLALSPRTFTKCVDAALAPLRLQGIRILNFIDDWLILAQSEMVAVRHRDVVLAHMKALGLRLNAKKSVLSPLQRTTYLGVVWNLTTMQAHLSPARIESILTAVKRVKLGRSLTVKQFQQLLGLMAAASNAIPFGLLYMRPLQWWLKTRGFSPRGNPFCMIKVTRQCLRAVDMWKKPWFLSQGPVLGAPCRRVTLATDASLTGWGAVMSGHPVRGLWSSRHLTWHISCLEMLAVFRVLKHFLPDLIGHHVLVRTDNTAVDKLLSLRAVHVPGHLNMGADILSRQGLRPGEWMLHREVLHGGLDAISTDVAEASSEPEFWNLWVWPLGGTPHSAPGLSTEVVETILQSRAPSSRKLYALKWKPFTSWCGDRQQDSVNCPVGTVLRFLQDRFSTGFAHSTLKVYVAAISAYYAPLGGSSVGRNPLVTRFLRGALRPRPLARCSLLSVVGMLFHSFESSDPPFLGLCSFTLGRDLKSGNETLRLGPYFWHPCSACFSIQKLPAACTARAFKLPGLYVTPPVTSRFSIGLLHTCFRAWSSWRRSPSVSTQRLVPSGNRGYIRNLRRFGCILWDDCPAGKSIDH
ncbi:Transposon Ty3-G Gag-Pol polyprotein [Labeo rohita]|uniref:ribonuclease H n=1 Tax=Labeo rohita TaxID=84645 RepID=A0ABQ8LXW6_LABRO|nr:Transposon Ty3-G Gag-Pol polyprotein [Labeo rohita]